MMWSCDPGSGDSQSWEPCGSLRRSEGSIMRMGTGQAKKQLPPPGLETYTFKGKESGRKKSNYYRRMVFGCRMWRGPWPQVQGGVGRIV